jgi:hypothetical protein
LKNKIIRLIELIQEDFPEELLAYFKTEEEAPLKTRLTLASKAISHHQQRSADLWLAAGNKRTPDEKKASARADLSAFLFAYLTGSPNENAQSAMEALEVLGRQMEVELIYSLCKKR